MKLVARIGKAPNEIVCRGFRVVHAGFLPVMSYEIVDGEPRRREAFARGAASVVVLPVDFRKRVLYLLAEIRPNAAFGSDTGSAFVRKVRRDGFTFPEEQFHVRAEDVRVFEACAGLVDVDPATGRPETPEAAAVRELHEECGLQVNEGRLIPVATYFPSIGGSCERTHAFFADLPDGHDEGELHPAGDGHEEIDVYRMSFDEAFRLLHDGRIAVASTQILLRELERQDLLRRLQELEAVR